MPYSELRKGRYSTTGMTYQITTVTAGRRPIFLDLRAARVVIGEMKTLQDQGMAHTLGYVLMPDHLHWLMTLQDGALARVMHLLKGRSAHKIGGEVWQPSYYDHALRRDEDLRATARYIVANPLRAGLVERIGDYPWWDSIWLGEELSG